MCGIKVSVIVPIYNIEAYLQRCVDSILCQTLREIEIILVDDGSTDSSGEICDAYSKMDERVVVIHKANGGLSDARNAGLDAARGEYIGFVDGDDFIRAEMYEVLYDACIRNHTRIASCNYIEQNRAEESFPSGEAEDKTRKLTATSFFEEVLKYQSPDKSQIGMGVWDKLYKKELFECIRFPVGKLHEDTDVLYQIVFQADFVMYISLPYYVHCFRKGSIMTQTYGAIDYDRYDANKGMFLYIMAHQHDLISVASENRCLSLLRIAYNMIDSQVYDQEMYRKIQKDCRELLPTVLKRKDLPLRLLYGLCVLCIGYSPLKTSRTLYKRFRKMIWRLHRKMEN